MKRACLRAKSQRNSEYLVGSAKEDPQDRSIRLAAALLTITTAFAGDLSVLPPGRPAGALAPGKPAGVEAAQLESPSPWVYVGAVAVAIGIALAISENSSGTTVQTTAPTGTAG
jgi:hypothetical protein